MKKKSLPVLLAILGIILALSLSLPSCTPAEPEPEYPAGINSGPVRVFIDIDFDSAFIKPTAKTVMKGFTKLMEELGGPQNIELEYPPIYGEDRDNYLTSLRTEIMAGKGPDVFICTSGVGYIPSISISGQFQDNSASGLFKFPQSIMEQRLFLPLDGYIEKAQFMEWDKLTPAIMDAGKNERGQQILPMAYTLPVTFLNQNDYHPKHSKTATFDDMLSEDAWSRRAMFHHSMYQTLVYKELVDVKKDVLGITEDEYLDYVNAWIELNEEAESSGIVCRESNMSVYAMDHEIVFDKFGEDPISIVPLYCKEGGYGALITTFGAINANTENPAGAFFILDYLMSREGQQSELFGHFVFNKSLPTYEGLMRQGKEWAVNIGDEEYWYMDEDDYAEFEQLRDNISWARFRTPIDNVFWNPGNTYLYSEDNEKPLETLVHENYTLMNMMLSES